MSDSTHPDRDAIARPTPKPLNWQGVAAGLKAAQDYMDQKQDQLAVNMLKEVLEFAPSEARAWRMLGAILERHNRHDKAASCLRRANRLEQSGSKTTPAASERLARLLWAQSEKQQARAMLTTLLIQRPEDEKLLSLKAEWSYDA